MLFNTLTPICSPITADPTGAQTLTLKLSLPAGRFVTIDWGDGNRTKVSGGVTEQDYAHAYSGAGSFPVRFYGDFRFLTRFQITGVSVSGTTERLGALSGLTNFACSGSNTISGNLSSLSSGLTNFYCSGSNTISGNLSSLSSGLTYFYCTGSNTISGDLSSLPSGMDDFRCYGSNTISGNLSSIPSGVTTFACDGSNTISGDLSSIPSGLTNFACSGSNTISGNLSSLPSGLTYFRCYGSNTISGNLSSLPSGVDMFECAGSNTISDYTSKVWTTKPSTFYFEPTGVGGLSTAEIDQLLIDFDDDLVWAAGNSITLTGTNAARSSASDAAVANMVAEGATVTTN